MKRLLAIVADGFEETELVAVVDCMRRLNVEVTVAGLNGSQLSGAHGMMLAANALLDALSPDEFDAVFLPGGLPGVETLYESPAVGCWVKEMADAGKVVSAICAAPIVLAKAGLLENRAFTMYPGFDRFLNGLKYSSAPAERDGNIVTGKGPGAVFAFAGKLAEALGLAEECRELFKGMFVEQK